MRHVNEQSLALLITATLLQLARGQVRVLSPSSLVHVFPGGKVDGSTATFGAPFYGDRVLGRLVYGESSGNQHCTESDYSIPAPDTIRDSRSSFSQTRIIDIIVVNRGKCTFVTKVKVASAKGAHAVIFVDEAPRGGRGDSEEEAFETKLREGDAIRRWIVAAMPSDDGYGDAISIPSIMITWSDGQKLIGATKSGEVIVELAWDIPTDHTVTMDLWMNSAAQGSQKFLKEFAPTRKILNEIVRFQPHYHVFSADSSTGYSGLMCWDTAAKWCAEPPESGGLVTGKMVLEEDVRQLCIHNLTKIARGISGTRDTHTIVFHAQKWWDYVSQLGHRCPSILASMGQLASMDRFGTDCSEALMKDVGIDVDKVRECVATTAEDRLESERVNKAWSPRALRVNGWRYNGMLEAKLVTRAVCSGFVKRPQECEEIIKPRDPTEKWLHREPVEVGVTLVKLIGMAFVFLVVVFIAACVYKGFLAKSMRSQINTEVMQEVSSQMASYRPLS